MTYRLDDEERKYKPGKVINDALSPEQRQEAEAGNLEVYDEFGHLVGLDGALEDGGSYYTVVPGTHPPSVDKCLEHLDEPYLRDLLKFAVNVVLSDARGSNRSISPRLVAARVRRLVANYDADLIFRYATGDKYDSAVYDELTAEVLLGLLPPGPIVIAVREVLALSDGSSILSAAAGREVREVGTTNKVKVSDYAGACDGAAAILFCRRAGFSITGFTGEPEPSEIIHVTTDAGITSAAILDGYGLMSDEFRGVLRAGFGLIAAVNTPDAAEASFLFAETGTRFDLESDARKAKAAADALWGNLKNTVN
ncbi:MAG: hypothetical protein JSW52_00230 [Candidatus Coatesbacteria bacterium]|nr:MAG: hypothetical protein JSW52_00230 [Candidatus Coatesbacteria bacterium]